MAEGDAELQDLYRDVLMDYFRDPEYRGAVPDPDLGAHGVNPVCGDQLELTLRTGCGGIVSARFDGHGCVISQASAAMMCEALEGRTLAQARELAARFKGFILEKGPIEDLPEAMEEVRALEGVRRFPARIKCALLGWNTLLEALDAGIAPSAGNGPVVPAASGGVRR